MSNNNRFVDPTSTRVPLSDGDWIEVKDELNTGEQKRLEGAGAMPPIKMADGSMFNPIDWERYELERAIIFLTDWSFRDKNDKPRKLNMDALRALDTDSFEEINRAVFRHVGDQLAKKSERKAKAQAAQTAAPAQETTPDPLVSPVSDPISQS